MNRGDGARPAVDDEGFADDESVEEEAMEVVPVAADAEVDEVLNGPRATVYYAVQVPPDSDTGEQGKDYTSDEVQQLMQSEAYQKKISTCHLCSKVWYDGMFSENCKECGNFAMTRPCPVCKGRCSKVWTRNVKMSHSYHKDYWEGTCGSPAFSLSDSTEDTTTLTAGLQDLSTS